MSDDPDAAVDPQTQRASVREGYDGLADDYRRERDAGGHPEAPEVEALLSGLDAGERVLDVGCGQGTPVLDRVAGDIDALGVDVSTAQLRLARERTNVALVNGDMTRLPVRDGVADAVTALHSIIHVPISEHPTVYAEFARVLRSGGRLLCTAAADEDGWTGANPDWLGSGERMAWSFPGLDRTLEQLQAAGFRVSDRRTLGDTVSDDDGGTWSLLTAELSEG